MAPTTVIHRRWQKGGDAMKSGIYPKCRAATVSTRRQGIGAERAITVDLTFWLSAELTTYVCTTCGYVESYVAELRELPKLAQHWQHVPPRHEPG
ncbi:MAG: hypothetical protein HGA19_00560 [Oscillochloris sp.]|nr:hypothetical protein [Oscillochloris sp.]